MDEREFDIRRLKEVLEEPGTSSDAFNEAWRRIKTLLSVSR